MLDAFSRAARSSGSADVLPSAVSRVASWARPILAAVARSWIIRRDQRILMEMRDHRLKDLGISRADITRVVRNGRP